MASANLKARKREDYNFSLEYRTRWYALMSSQSIHHLMPTRLDNDMYDHMNNSVYYLLFDSVVNTYLINHCSLHPPTSNSVGLVVHSHCDYMSPTGFPAIIDLCLRVNKLGKSSVTYEIGVFERGTEEVKAVGEFVHVFVERESMKPGKSGMDEKLREGLGRIAVGSKMAKL